MCGSCGGSSGRKSTTSPCSARCPGRTCSCPLPISCIDVMGSNLWVCRQPAVWPCNPCCTEPERDCCQKRFVPFPTCNCGPPPCCTFNVKHCYPSCGGGC